MWVLQFSWRLQPASDGARVFHDQIQVLTKNLSSLNTIYELELQESNNHLKALNGFYGKLAETSNAMLASANDAKNVQVKSLLCQPTWAASTASTAIC
jgi:hypothetical protein